MFSPNHIDLPIKKFYVSFTSMDELRVHIVVTGLVQGVFFRASTVEVANRIGLTGWVRNTQEGSVEIVAEGTKKAADELIRWCGTGPDTARVDKVETAYETYRGIFRDFRVEA